MLDLVERFIKRSINEARRLLFSRALTLFWAGLFIVFASLFENTENPVVELGLAIASFTYGGLLGGIPSWNYRQGGTGMGCCDCVFSYDCDDGTCYFWGMAQPGTGMDLRS